MKKILFFMPLALTVMGARAQWTNDPETNTRFVEESTYSTEMQVLSDGSWFLYTDGPTGGAIVPMLRYYDKNGVSQWEEPIQIADEPTQTYTVYNDLTFLDRDENLIVVTRDLRMGDENSYTAYKFDKKGNALWGRGKSLHGEFPPAFCAALKIVQLADGSYVFAWQEGYGTSQIGMQRLSADGEPMWGDGKFIAEEDISLTYPYMVEAGNNEFIVMYARGTTEELWARKMDFDGNDVWAQPTLMFNGSMGSVPLWTRMKVIPLDGGLLAAFPAFVDDLEVPYLSWVKNDGSHGFADAEKGFRIGYTDNFRTGVLDAVANEEEKTIYAIWREFDPLTQSNQRIALQKVGFNGELLWDPTGATVAPLDLHTVAYYSVQLGPKNTVLAAYMENVGGNGSQIIEARAVYFDADGKYVWNDTTVVFANYEGSKGSLVSSPLVGDQWFFLWDDNRDFDNLTYHNVYGQNLHMDGTLGVKEGGDPGVANEKAEAFGKQVRLYPNPATETVNVLVNRFSDQVANLRVELLGLNGASVTVMYEGSVSGNADLVWNRPAGIASGLYIVRVTDGSETYYGKIILK
ncbi:MAG: T9SS type A sorting domain-containing protein [Bacteroides sp.]|nr:T9SS type A sorting domain-containing protein [Ruminococcus flavefaciens]MCM1554980.1 T9SS type A sorting domain-containing protein [Bacteroides sp.]